jgi:hypothetical protein
VHVFRLTSIGWAAASSTDNNGSDEYSALSQFRRHGGVRTDEQLSAFFGNDKMRARMAVNQLLSADAPKIVELASH